MPQKTIATFLILSAFAIAGANSASAEDGGFAVASTMEVVAYTDEYSTNGPPPSSWAATDTPTTMDLALPVTMSALSSGSVR
jgi:hypothetical protein